MRRDPAYLLDLPLAAMDALSYAAGLDQAGIEASKPHQGAIPGELRTPVVI